MRHKSNNIGYLPIVPILIDYVQSIKRPRQFQNARSDRFFLRQGQDLEVCGL